MKQRGKLLLKLRNMKKYVDFLKSQGNITKEKLKKEYTLRSAIERNFHMALESVFDIGEMIISIRELRKPEDYKDITEILGEERIYLSLTSQDIIQTAISHHQKLKPLLSPYHLYVTESLIRMGNQDGCSNQGTPKG